MHHNLVKAVQILKDLVAFDVLGGQTNLAIIDHIEKFLTAHQISYQLVPNEEGNKTSLHCRIGPAVDGGLILSGHTDVVPVKGQDWNTDPFVLTEYNGKLYGRGSCDMKGFLACCLANLGTFKQADLKKPIYFAFSYDEEIGCLAGSALANAILNHYEESPKYAIIGEPSMMQPVIGQKGICVLETKVHGSAGHSSRIKQEVSAIHIAAKLIVWLEQKMDEFIHKGSINPLFDPPHTSLHVGVISGGIAPNVIADQCSFYWDVRVIPEDSVADILADFDEYCMSIEVEMRKKYAGAFINTSMNHPPVPPLGTHKDASIVNLIQEITGKQSLSTVAYAAEAGQFSEVGFEAVICGPGDIAQAHRANEFIAGEQLNECLQMLDKLALLFSE
jgi:acetylornithine deacetylase